MEALVGHDARPRQSFFDLGNPFNTAGQQDLAFRYVLNGDSIASLSVVAYEAIGSTLPGDYNNDSIVDAADYTVWRDGLGTIYTEADYDVWKAHFGETAGAGSGAMVSAAVPEPATWLLVLLGMAGLTAMQRRVAVCRSDV